MLNKDEDQKSRKSSYAADHMANERTFLAWVRTSIGIMTFGFVVEKFALFIKQMALLLGKFPSSLPPSTSTSLQGYSSLFGVLLVGLGMLICLLAFIKYKKVEREIESDTYYSSTWLSVMLTLSILLSGIFLLLYLNNNI